MKIDLKYILVIILVFACSFGEYSSSAQVNANQVVAIGRNLLSLEDYALSKLYFNMAIKARPQWEEPYYYRALAKLYLEDYRGAEEDCSAAIERHPFKTDAYKLRGFVRQQLGYDSLAISDYDMGLKHNPMERDFLFYKALAQSSLGKYDDADSTYSILLRYFPKYGEGYSGRAQMKLQRGDTVGALEDLNYSVTISKNLLNSYLMRAEVMMKRQEWDKALADIDVAIKLRPQEADYYINRGYVRYNLDDFFGAMSDYNYAIELEPFNTSAIFNRGLLRYEVKDLENSAADFSTVLNWDSSNFHARFNRALVYIEQGKNREAIEDFRTIAQRYPKFYPVYHGIAKAYLNMGDEKRYMENVLKANDLIGKYVNDPENNPLDKPTIAQGRSNDRGNDRNENESEIDVMNRFNQLVTVREGDEGRVSYNSKIKGRVQDRNVRVEIEPMYAVTFYDSPNELRSRANYSRELDELNQGHYLDNPLYLSNDEITPSDNTEMQNLFNEIENYNSIIAGSRSRPIDYFGRGVIYTMLKNYEAALDDFNRSIVMNNDFALAYLSRGYTKMCLYEIQFDSAEKIDEDTGKNSTDAMFENRRRQQALSEIIADFDRALQADPGLSFAWFNKGNVYYIMQDMTSALNCYSEAIRLNPDFGQAYFNRGLVYLQMGNKLMGNTDLRKAGELGILPSYNVLKRMN